ncbi:MAG: FprA family A-type flavoprotein [Oscillospiraceae bacterium]|nr:FprA family A-type flavoprotein [Oscillospiraceae bacterium]
MYTARKVTEDICFVGGEDRRLNLFENVYPVPQGVSYNAYLILDEKTCLMDCVDKSAAEVLFENLDRCLGGRGLDYVVVQHMEPDHSAALMRVLARYPEAKLVTSKKALDMVSRFFGKDLTERAVIVGEGSTLSLGRHSLRFVAAPMVHWPEVLMTYDEASGALFTADAFGTFGALDGAVFADEVDFDRDYMDEARRYYTNIVGKYGAQVQSVLKKAAGLDIKMLCPLHGFVWRKDLDLILDKYQKWSSYTAEEAGVTLAYGSVYGNTENAARALASLLRERGVKVRMFDVSVTHPSYIIASCFRYSAIVLAAPTYNNGVFVNMEAFINDLTAHGLKGRKVALMQNGTWVPNSAAGMRKLLEGAKGLDIMEETVTVPSALRDDAELIKLADALAAAV